MSSSINGNFIPSSSGAYRSLEELLDFPSNALVRPEVLRRSDAAVRAVAESAFSLLRPLEDIPDDSRPRFDVCVSSPEAEKWSPDDALFVGRAYIPQDWLRQLPPKEKFLDKSIVESESAVEGASDPSQKPVEGDSLDTWQVRSPEAPKAEYSKRSITHYTEDEMAEIRRLHALNVSSSEIAAVLKQRFGTTRTALSITQKITRMCRKGILQVNRRGVRYSKEEEILLKQLSEEGLSPTKISDRLFREFGAERTALSIRSKRAALKRKAAASADPDVFSKEELELIMRLFRNGVSVLEISEKLYLTSGIQRPYQSVWRQISRLQDEGILMQRKRVRGFRIGAAGEKREREESASNEAKKVREEALN